MAMLQLVLDLFGVAPAAPAFEPKAPPALEEQAPAAPQLIADEPAVALGDALMPAHFAHPRANRAIDFAHARVHYEFQRGQRRTIGFSVGPDGLAVRAPRWTPLHEVEAALREKERWIVAKLGEARERHARIESNRIDWKDGATYPDGGVNTEAYTAGAFIELETLGVLVTLAPGASAMHEERWYLFKDVSQPKGDDDLARVLAPLLASTR